MDRKGQGLSMNVIIIAAISLLVLVILTTLVIERGSKVAETSDCETAVPGAYCEDADRECDSGFTEDLTKDCPSEQGKERKCCIPLEEQ